MLGAAHKPPEPHPQVLALGRSISAADSPERACPSSFSRETIVFRCLPALFSHNKAGSIKSKASRHTGRSAHIAEDQSSSGISTLGLSGAELKAMKADGPHAAKWRAQQESNLQSSLRRGKLYPFNYGPGGWSAQWAQADQTLHAPQESWLYNTQGQIRRPLQSVKNQLFSCPLLQKMLQQKNGPKTLSCRRVLIKKQSQSVPARPQGRKD